MDERRRKAIGAVLRELRDEAHLTRPALAARTATATDAPISVEMIAKVEAGVKAPSTRTLDRLAAALGEETSVITTRAAARELAQSSNPQDLTHLSPRVLGAIAAGGVATVAGGMPLVPVVAGTALGTYARSVVRKRKRRRTDPDAMHRDLDQFLATATSEEREELAAILKAVSRRPS